MSLYKVLATQIWTSRTLSQNGCGGLVTKSCLTLGTPWTGSLPGSSVHRILQPRILGWVASSFSKGSSQPKNWTQVSCFKADSLLTELLGKPLSQNRHIKNIYLGIMFVFTFSSLQFCKKKKKILIIKWKDKSICAFPSPYFLIHCSACSVSSWKSISSNRGGKCMGLHNGLTLINSINH